MQDPFMPQGSPQQERDLCTPRFFVRAILDNEKTDEAGYPVFSDTEYVEVIMPKSKNFRPCFKVTDIHRRRWPAQYAAFKNSQEAVADGFRLDEWSLMPRSIAETLKGIQIYTMEQFVGIPEDDLRIFGPGVPELQRQADEILKNRDEKQEQIDKLTEQNEELAKRLEALENAGAETASDKRKANLEKARAAKAEKAKRAAAGE